ncbi:hypothetical protein EUGRSUZ_G00346 [Eucalyptus grandis]|uniref:Uncharacterized protein n=2 Tax=Eucalyptus grandis TaxID=71139 RepID=A0A059BA21_EUCGR|nr:hypothetical protein EUGRSUZ_G00346 [Eucalyptus grandis]
MTNKNVNRIHHKLYERLEQEHSLFFTRLLLSMFLLDSVFSQFFFLLMIPLCERKSILYYSIMFNMYIKNKP